MKPYWTRMFTRPQRPAWLVWPRLTVDEKVAAWAVVLVCIAYWFVEN